MGTANNPKQNVKSHSISNNKINTVNTVITTTTLPVTTTTQYPNTTTVAPSPNPAPQQELPQLTLEMLALGVTPYDISAWSKVASCEEGGNWAIQGSMYSGGLGMLNQTWVAYGGLDFTPNAGLATMVQQIAVAKRIQPNPPDQNGCSGPW